MTYSFRDAVIAKLPKSCTFVRMYSTCSEETHIEVLKDGKPLVLSMSKVNISDYFYKTPVFFIGAKKTYNDLYKMISDKYGLGLVDGIDYYDANVIEPTENMQYVEMPVLKDSYGYYGDIRCYIVKGTDGITSPAIEKDLSGEGSDLGLSLVRLRAYGMTSVHTDKRPIFVKNRLSVGFIDSIVGKIEKNGETSLASYCRDVLIQAVVIDNINDGISDLILLRLKSGETLFIRFKSEKGDLPTIVENNDDNDVETDNSKEGLVGDAVEVGVGEGDYNYTEEELPLGNDDDLSIPSVDLPEDNFYEENDIEIEL